MLRAGYFIIIIILITPNLFSSITALDDENFSEIISSDQYGPGYRYNIQGWVYLHIEGEPYERGYQYGYLASAEIIEMIQRWANYAQKVEFMKYFIFKNQPDRYDDLAQQWWDICRYKSMNIFLYQVPEEYVNEMRGMADGIKDRGGKIFGRDIEFEDIVASQFVQEVQYTLDNIKKGIHPILGFLDGLKDMFSGDITNPDGHCNAFIATGDATREGDIVAAHATIYPNYIAERCNFIVDIEPSDGYRFVMTCPPGSLWSQEDWYQNEQGIILTETEIGSQGPWKTRGTTPKGVRSREAVQYSSSIDEVLRSLEEGNNGLIPNEWLIGDKKTGEIATYEQGLFTQNLKRTNDGYYWSSNVPHKTNLMVELYGIPKIFLKAYGLLTQGKGDFKVDGENIIWNWDRAAKLIELGERYYGDIDTEIAKKIMSTPPLVDLITDCKITNSKLTENLGFIAFMGKANGVTWVPDEKTKKEYRGVTILPPTDWVEVYPSNSRISDLSSFKYNNVDTSQKYDLGNKEINSKTLWQYDTIDNGNINYSHSAVSDDMLYTTTSTGMVYALDSHNGREKWSMLLADTTVDPVLSDDTIFIGSDKGLHAISKENGKILWEQTIGRIASKPVISGNNIIVGCETGRIYIFDIESGDQIWEYTLSDAAYISELNGNNMFYVASGETCYGFDYTTKEKIWSFDTDGMITSAPRKKGNSVYLGSWDGNIYTLDAKTGDKKWSFETGWGIDSTPAVSDGTVFVGSLDNNFYALDADNGNPIWYFNCKSAIHSNPVAYGDYVFFGCDDGRVYALDQDNGALAWSYAPGYFITDSDVNNYITTPILSNLYIDDGVVYFGANGSVYALDAQTFEKPVEKEDKTEFDITNIVLAVFLLIVICLFMFLYVFRKKDGTHKK